MHFYEALKAMRDGEKVARKNWVVGIYIVYIYGPPEEIIIFRPKQDPKQWSPGHEGLVAHDWIIVE